MKSLYNYSKTKLIVSIVLLVFAIIFLLPLMLRALQSVIYTDITPDTSFGYTVDDLKEMRGIYGQEGAKRYFLTRFTYDVIWPLIYLFFIINIFAFLLDGLKGRVVRGIKVLPFSAVLFDFFENMFCSIYFFNGNRVVGIVASISSRLKWYFLYLILILFLVLGIKKYVRSKRQHKGK